MKVIPETRHAHSIWYLWFFLLQNVEYSFLHWNTSIQYFSWKIYVSYYFIFLSKCLSHVIIVKLRFSSLRHRWHWPILVILFTPFWFLALKDLNIIRPPNILALSVPDESYSRNASCAPTTLLLVPDTCQGYGQCVTVKNMITFKYAFMIKSTKISLDRCLLSISGCSKVCGHHISPLRVVFFILINAFIMWSIDMSLSLGIDTVVDEIKFWLSPGLCVWYWFLV